MIMVAMPVPTLQDALNSLPFPSDPPMLLPAGHLAPAGCFESIASEGKLRLKYCETFSEELLYLSYGGIHFRGKNLQTSDGDQLPVGFLFGPGTLDTAARALPFDSGAAAAGRFGPVWTERLRDFRERFQLWLTDGPNLLCKLVFYLYGGNAEYLRGTPKRDCTGMPEPIPDLCQFLSADLSSLGVDHRQQSIECLFESEITFGPSLLWIGYPSARGREIETLYARIKPWVPELFSYSGHQNSNPLAAAAILEHEASHIAKRFVELKP
jgi:hypothetical protein